MLVNKLFKPKLIPRLELKCKVITKATTGSGWPEDRVEDIPNLENCGVQPITGWQINALPEGLRNSAKYRLYTTSELSHYEEREGAPIMKVEWDSKWWEVREVRKWNYGVQSHYEAILVEDKVR